MKCVYCCYSLHMISIALILSFLILFWLWLFLYIFTFHNSFEVEVCFDLSFLFHFSCSFKFLVLVFVAHSLFWCYASIYNCGLQLLVIFLCYWGFVVSCSSLGMWKLKTTCLSMCPCNMYSMSLQVCGFSIIFAFFYFAPFKLFDLSIVLYVFVIVLFTMASISFFFKF